MSGRIRWEPVIDAAAEWVEAQRFTVSLRQTFYHLVATQRIPNDTGAYKRLSSLTAERRRAGTFPALSDGTREILRLPGYADLSSYAPTAARRFTLDRTRDQDHLVVVGVEKRGMSAAAWEQFGARGFLVVAMGGYTSATITMELADRIEADGRPAVLLYAGDYDASGEDIYRYLTENVPFDREVLVALTEDQVDEFDLPVNPGKDADTRAAGFAARHGANVQVEVDALDPETLAALFADAAAEFWDESAFDEVIAEETEIRQRIIAALGGAA